MRVSEPSVLFDKLYFPECLRWRSGRLWFSDMLRGTVHTVIDDQVTPQHQLKGLAGGLGWLPDGRLLVAAMEARQILAVGADGELSVHADLTDLFAYPINDMYVDETGRAYVGGYGFDADNGAELQTVQLAIVQPDGAATLSGPQLAFPNGIDRRGPSELFVAETLADRITALHLDDSGNILSHCTFATLANGDGPDGIAADGSGGLWVACAYGQRAVHFDADGVLDATVPVPGRGVLDCAVSADRARVLLATASTDEAYAAEHQTGAILTVDVSAETTVGEETGTHD